MHTAWHANNDSVITKLLHRCYITFVIVTSVLHHTTNY